MTRGTANTINEVIKLQKHSSRMFFNWFFDNQLKTNISKIHLLVHKKQDETFKRRGDTQKNSEHEKLLLNKIDTKINFNKDLSDIIHCVKSVQLRSYFWSEYRKIRNINYSIFGHFSRSDPSS